MMEVNISIGTNEIYDDVYAITSNTGKAMEDIDKASLSEDDMSIIGPFFNESASELGGIISNYGTVSFDSDSISVSLLLPSNWDEGVKDSLAQCIKNYISNSICQRWFYISKKDDSEYYSEKVTVNAKNMESLLNRHKKPEREVKYGN